MSNLYLWLKTIHILGVVLFLGNIIVTGWWKVMADRTKEPSIIAFAQQQVIATDLVFTAGGAALLFIAGGLNVLLNGLGFSVTWILAGLLFFSLSGLIWAFILIPIQTEQSQLAKAFSQNNAIPDRYWALCKRWNIWGAIATLLPLCNLVWMTFKPTAL